jgi:hypothetical protein
LKHAFKFQ